MSVSEFELIRRYFTRPMSNTTVNRLGIGDDCALMAVPDGFELAITTDTMVEGVHFFADADPGSLGYKLLAVNLSDLAAMGAKPVAVSLALTLPVVNEQWLEQFATGFFSLAQQFGVDLIGGDTTSGHRTLTVQAIGLVPKGKALKRSSAQIGDLIYVTGCLGDAGLGLKIAQGYKCQQSEQVLKRFHQPEPRVRQGLAIARYASACIDLSDGIASDLKHILQQSGVAARLDWGKIPLSAAVVDYINHSGDWALPLSAGEDYELCFTVNPHDVELINVECWQIGVIEAGSGLLLQRAGNIDVLSQRGFEHFS